MPRAVYEKLGLKEDVGVLVVNPPRAYEDLVEFPSFEISSHQGEALCRFIHLFCSTALELESDFPRLMGMLAKDGMFWVSWPKGSSKLPKNINENDIRKFGLEMGLVDVKVCAIDVDWSGLKFMYRRKDR